jgi:hypothetical protein
MSNNLSVTVMVENQANKHITYNTAIGRLDSAMTAALNVPVTSTNLTTISALNISGYFSFNVTNSGANGPVTVSVATLALPRGLFRVTNSVGQLLTVTIPSQPLTAPVLIPGETALLHSDGINVVKVQGSSTEIGGFAPGVPGAGATLLRYVAARPFTLPVALPLSRGYVEVAPTVASAVFDLRKNATSIGSMTFAVASQTATFTLATATTFAAGDRLAIWAPSPANATLTDVSFNLIALV